MLKKRGQVTIFIILAILIVAGVSGFFILRNKLIVQKIPSNIQPIYSDFLSCLQDKTKIGINFLESQAGYIELPELELGSTYSPFSSQLNFFGSSVPYWYYISGNNLQKEQIPSLENMEKDLGSFLESKIDECNFDSYYDEGFEITKEKPKASIKIEDNKVVANVEMKLYVSKETDSYSVLSHRVEVESKLGTLYASAKKIYEKEQKELFLENYAVDILRLYAPVDGVEISCSPKTWDVYDVYNDLKKAIELNTLALRTAKPTTKNQKYFFIDSPVEQEVKFFNFEDWPSAIEVLPSEGNTLIASPVGNQQGLGIIGFCYVPYHFVYSLKYPVLIQIIDGEETFQFPVAVVLEGNRPRIALNATPMDKIAEICPNKNTLTNIQTYNQDSQPVDASISYSCINEECYIGETLLGKLESEFPQCINGILTIRALGYAELNQIISTNKESSVSVMLNKLYSLNLQTLLGNQNSADLALISFASKNNIQTISYPSQKIINLSEGDYNVSVYVYKNSSIKLQETVTEECSETLSTGIGGVFGFKDKTCKDVTIPAQVISNVLIGGGKAQLIVSEYELKNSNSIIIKMNELVLPKSMEDLQKNYFLVEQEQVEVSLG